MSDAAPRLHAFEPGGYAFLEGNFRYSQGVVAMPGYAFRRIRLTRALPLTAGFSLVEQTLRAADRPMTALAAFELRCAQPYAQLSGFDAFNKRYGTVLRDWGLTTDGLNPVARSNVAPAYTPPGDQIIHAFTFTVPRQGSHAALVGGQGGPADFVVAGSGEWPENTAFPDGIVAFGDTSAAGIEKKAAYVLDTMRARVAGLNADWSRVSAAQVYCVHDWHGAIDSAFARRELAHVPLTWHLARPPLAGLDFEMDVRCVHEEALV
jgi:hypothetical protein